MRVNLNSEGVITNEQRENEVVKISSAGHNRSGSRLFFGYQDILPIWSAPFVYFYCTASHGWPGHSLYDGIV